jgi:hypothetical protein
MRLWGLLGSTQLLRENSRDNVSGRQGTVIGKGGREVNEEKVLWKG